VQANDNFTLGLQLCLYLVFTAQEKARAAAIAAPAAVAAPSANRCSMALVSVPIEVQRTSSGYAATFAGKTSKASSSPLKVTCRATGTGLDLKVRPASRHRKLRSLVGPKFSVGFSNAGGSPVRIRSTYTFRSG
jgi:hypothetical protein